MTGVLVAIFSALALQDRIAKLALDPLAHELPEVSRYASRLVTQFERERLAQWIAEMLGEARQIPDGWFLSRRVLRYADQLAVLGEELSDPISQIRPASAAALHILLTQAVDSPLYNPAVPADRDHRQDPPGHHQVAGHLAGDRGAVAPLANEPVAARPRGDQLPDRASPPLDISRPHRIEPTRDHEDRRAIPVLVPMTDAVQRPCI